MKKVKIVLSASPAELRYWASMLEKGNVTISWYSTDVVFENSETVEHSVEPTLPKRNGSAREHIRDVVESAREE